MKILTENYWSTIINIILQSYFSELTTTCILWPNNFDFQLKTSSTPNNVYMLINPLNLSESFNKDFYNFSLQDERFKANGIQYNNLTKKFIASLKQTHCEGFLAFQDDIPLMAAAFRQASLFSIWRSLNNRFLFVYTKDQQKEHYFQDIFFKNQANILLIEADFLNSSLFSLKTTKFVGSIFENPQELIQLSTFNALNNSFSPPLDLFSPDKFKNLQGREIIVGVFDYRPFVAVDFKRLPQYYDHSGDNPSHLVHVDGTEIRICHTFCEIYNCSVQFDTSEKEDWGIAFSNYSGKGLMGMILEGKTHLAMEAMYALYFIYETMDVTTFVGRSGITCLVPAPTRLVSWTLPFRPFHLTLWLAVGLCLLLETFALIIAKRFEQTLENGHRSWWSCLEFAYIATLQLFISQNSRFIVNTHTMRTVLVACYMLDIIITSLYGGGLSATLTVPILGETADSLEKLYNYNLTWTATSYDWVEALKLDAEDKKSIFSRLLSNFEINSFNEMREKSKTENMGFILERMTFGHFGNGEFLTAQALQRLKLMVDDIYSQFTVVIVPRLWPHLPKYNDLILAWHSSGLDKYWEWKMTADYLNVNEQNQVQASMNTNFDNGPVVLDIQNFAGVITMWVMGMILSIVVFMGELLVNRIKQNIERKIVLKHCQNIKRNK